ncbi:MAG TPA: sigma-70 family RNA polymerase sigma factor [Elusimicrobiota bacterium]|nr:sigma-70 family RNA polymerase sigma factor [Elusimicrobiota bacterium]
MRDSLDPLTLYFRGIKRLRKISKEEMVVLWRQAKKGDKKAQKRLVEANLRLVIPMAKKYYRSSMDFLDLVEEGNLGLMHAVEKFDPRKGFRFSTYASYWIEQSIRRALDEQSKTIRIPPHAWDALRKWLKEWDHIRGQLGREPTLAEMTDKLHLTARQVRNVMEASEASRAIGSLDTPLDEDENIFVRDVVFDKVEKGPEQILYSLKLHDELEKALQQIGSRERKIIEMRFGLNNQDMRTLEDVGKKLRLSRERVRQLEERGLLRLKRAAQRAGIS